LDPVAFEILGVEIRWYGILISIGMLLGYYLALREARKIGVNEEKMLDLFLVVIPAAIIGARLYYVLFNLDYYKNDIIKMINIREGGLAIHGGVIAGVLAGYIFTRVNKLDFWKLADVVAPSIILGQAIGRWGNYINQEAYGRPTNLPWGIIINGVKVHPTFLYESIWDFLVFLFLIFYRKSKKYDGEIFHLYVILYSIGRFFIEGLRIDSLMIGPFRTAQVLSLALIVIFGFLLIRKRLEIKRNLS